MEPSLAVQMDTCFGLKPGMMARRQDPNRKGGVSSSPGSLAGRDLTKDPLTWNEIDERLAHMQASRAAWDADPQWQRMVAAVGARKSSDSAPRSTRRSVSSASVCRRISFSLSQCGRGHHQL